IRGHGLQKPGAEQPVNETFARFLGDLLARNVKLAREQNLIDANRRSKLESFFARALADLEPGVGGEFTHRDLHPGNVIVEEQGIGYFVNGIIDLEHCRFWDRLWDFAKLQWLAFERHPSLAEPFLAAYESMLPRPPDYEARTRLYRAAEALISL